MSVVCDTCFRGCKLEEGQTGICRSRKNDGGRIIPANYGRLTSMALDPIEKKPLNMFYPGSMILSVGSFGCNLRCPFCQNHEISMAGDDEEWTFISPQELADTALKYRDRGNIGVAFTYNEPLIGWEYVLDTAMLVRDMGMKNVLVTNGTASLEVLKKLILYIDAMNIDLKGFTGEYYRMVGGDFEMTKAFITEAARGCHVELTTLIVPGENDSPSDMENEARWIASIDRSIPLHISRFFPRYHMTDRPATDVRLVYDLADVARGHLENVFTGNC